MTKTIRTLTTLGLLMVALLLLPAIAAAQPFQGELTPKSVKVYGATTCVGTLTVHGAMTATTSTLTILNLAPTNLTPTNLAVSSSAKLPETTPTANRQAGFDNGVLKWYYGSLRTGLYDVTGSAGITGSGTGATRALTIDRSVVVTNPVAGAGLTGGGAPSAGSSTLAAGAGTGITVNADNIAIDPTYVTTQPVAGSGLTGSGVNPTFAVGAGTGISVSADAVGIDPAYVTTAPTAGAGLTGSGVNPTFAVGAGTGINVAADSVSIDGTVVVTDVTGGAGLTDGGGPSGGTVSLSVNAGTGVTTTGDAVGIDPTVVVTSITAGAGLSGGGTPSGGAVAVAVAPGRGITNTGDVVAIGTAFIQAGDFTYAAGASSKSVDLVAAMADSTYSVVVTPKTSAPATEHFNYTITDEDTFVWSSDAATATTLTFGFIVIDRP